MIGNEIIKEAVQHILDTRFPLSVSFSTLTVITISILSISHPFGNYRNRRWFIKNIWFWLFHKLCRSERIFGIDEDSACFLAKHALKLNTSRHFQCLSIAVPELRQFIIWSINKSLKQCSYGFLLGIMMNQSSYSFANSTHTGLFFWL